MMLKNTLILSLVTFYLLSCSVTTQNVLDKDDLSKNIKKDNIIKEEKKELNLDDYNSFKPDIKENNQEKKSNDGYIYSNDYKDKVKLIDNKLIVNFKNAESIELFKNLYNAKTEETTIKNNKTYHTMSIDTSKIEPKNFKQLIEKSINNAKRGLSLKDTKISSVELFKLLFVLFDCTLTHQSLINSIEPIIIEENHNSIFYPVIFPVVDNIDVKTEYYVDWNDYSTADKILRGLRDIDEIVPSIDMSQMNFLTLTLNFSLFRLPDEITENNDFHVIYTKRIKELLDKYNIKPQITNLEQAVKSILKEGRKNVNFDTFLYYDKNSPSLKLSDQDGKVLGAILDNFNNYAIDKQKGYIVTLKTNNDKYYHKLHLYELDSFGEKLLNTEKLRDTYVEDDNNTYSIKFSMDSSKIAYLYKDKLTILDKNSLQTLRTESDVCNFNWSYSSSIMVLTKKINSNNQIFILNSEQNQPDFSKLTQISDIQFNESSMFKNILSPIITKDYKNIIYIKDSNLWNIDIDNNKNKLLVNLSDKLPIKEFFSLKKQYVIKLSSNGKKIAYITPTDENKKIYNLCTINIDGTDAKQITNLVDEEIQSFFWENMGEKIFYSTNKINSDNKTSIYSINSNGSENNKLIEKDNISMISY